MKSYFLALYNFKNFNGRASLKEYWMFSLLSAIITIALIVVDIKVGYWSPLLHMGMFSSIYTLLILMPTLAVTVRRLHDTGRSGWYSLISMIPILGVFILLCWVSSNGEEYENEYGINPNYIF